MAVEPPSIAAPSGAEAGLMAPSGRHEPAEGLVRKRKRGLQDRVGLPAFSGAKLGEGFIKALPAARPC